MARRRLHKPLLPGLWTGVAFFVLIGCIGGLFWALGKSTQLNRAAPQPVPAVAKGK